MHLALHLGEIQGEILSGTMDKEGGFIHRPPILDRVNYDYWKPHMVAYIKSLDNRAWKAVIKGWSHPVSVGADGETDTKLKPKEDWSKEEDELSLGNSKASNDIFN